MKSLESMRALPVLRVGHQWLMRGAPVIFLILWSAGFPIARIGLQFATPLALLTLRFALSGAVLLALYALWRPPLPRGARAWWDLFVVGFLVQVMYFGLGYLALEAGLASGLLALVVSLQPVLVGVLAPRLLGERVSVRAWIGLILGLAGAAGVIVLRGRVAGEAPGPLLLAIGSLLGLTGGMVYEKRITLRQDPLMANLVQYLVGLAFCVPMSFMFEHWRVRWTGPFIGALLYLVIGNSLIAISLLLAMTRANQVFRVASLFFLVPPAAALMSYALLGEKLPLLAWPAMGVSAAGVALGVWRRPAR